MQILGDKFTQNPLRLAVLAREFEMFLNIAKSRPWYRRLLVFSVGLIAIVSVIPHGSEGQTALFASIGLDKIAHFIGFACLSVLAFGTCKQLSFWPGVRVAAYVLIFGIAIEFIQYYIPYRTFNPVDIFANLSGVVFGVFLWVLLIAHGAKGMERNR